MIVPYAAGGGVVDVQTRALTTDLAGLLGQPIVVAAKPGANANIGADTVAKAAPDGYTWLVSAPFLLNNPLSSVALPQIRAGKLRVLANASGKRSADLPDTPTIAEAGFPTMTVQSWYGLHVPAGTPGDVVSRISAEIGKVAGSAAFAERLSGAGGEAGYLDAKAFAAFLKEDAERWAKFAKVARRPG